MRLQVSLSASFVYDETVHFAETLQTQYGEVKIMAKTATMNELGEI